MWQLFCIILFANTFVEMLLAHAANARIFSKITLFQEELFHNINKTDCCCWARLMSNWAILVDGKQKINANNLSGAYTRSYMDNLVSYYQSGTRNIWQQMLFFTILINNKTYQTFENFEIFIKERLNKKQLLIVTNKSQSNFASQTCRFLG